MCHGFETGNCQLWSWSSWPWKKICLRKIKLLATTAGKYGVRLSGLRVYRPQQDNYLIRRSKHNHIHTKAQLTKTIKLFLHDGIRLRTELIQPFIEQLSVLLSALQNQTTFEFRASSVLLIYEGNPSSKPPPSPRSVPHVQGSESFLIPPRIDVRLIDFDHAFIRDENGPIDAMGVRTGIQSLLSIMKKIGYEYHSSQSESEVLLEKEAKYLRKKLNHCSNTASSIDDQWH